MPPITARRHRSRSSVDSLLELVHGLDDHEVHRLLADFNNTSEGNVAVAKAIDLFQRPTSPPRLPMSPKFDFGPRRVKGRSYNLHSHHAATSPTWRAFALTDGSVSTTTVTPSAKRISSAPLLHGDRTFPMRHSPSISEAPTSNQYEPSSTSTNNTSATFAEARPPSPPQYAPPPPPSPSRQVSLPTDPLSVLGGPPLPTPLPQSQPPQKGPRSYKRFSRPRFHLPLSSAKDQDHPAQKSLRVPALTLGLNNETEHEEEEPSLRALLLAAYTSGDGLNNLLLPQSPSTLRAPRSMVNLRSRRQQEQDEEFGFGGMRPTTPDNLLLEPLPGFGLASPVARIDSWRMDSLFAVLNEA